MVADYELSDATAALKRHTDRGLDDGRASVVYQRVSASLDTRRRPTWRPWIVAGLVSAAVVASMALFVVCSTPQSTQLARAPATPMKLSVQ